ncbi:MAG: hypothetical protein L3J59_13295 [Methylococcaceae bacterium]|nr:hypothetical protein [Methylococcaceae bacterium]
MERCPCCNARLGKVISCPRCQADLTVLNNVEQMAKLWLKKAINYWLDNHLEKSLDALMLSLRLKKTRVAVTFQKFIIQQQCQNILEFLVKNQLYSAKKRLLTMRHLFLYHQQLQQLNFFVDSLLIKECRSHHN